MDFTIFDTAKAIGEKNLMTSMCTGVIVSLARGSLARLHLASAL